MIQYWMDSSLCWLYQPHFFISQCIPVWKCFIKQFENDFEYNFMLVWIMIKVVIMTPICFLNWKCNAFIFSIEIKLGFTDNFSLICPLIYLEGFRCTKDSKYLWLQKLQLNSKLWIYQFTNNTVLLEYAFEI